MENAKLAPDQTILDILSEAINGAVTQSVYILHLLEKVDDGEQKELLNQIRMIRHKHIRCLKDIYLKLTGVDAIPAEPDVIHMPESRFGAQKAYKFMVHWAIDAAEYYRQIYFGFASPEIRDILFEMMSDEQNIALLILSLSL